MPDAEGAQSAHVIGQPRAVQQVGRCSGGERAVRGERLEPRPAGATGCTLARNPDARALELRVGEQCERGVEIGGYRGPRAAREHRGDGRLEAGLGLDELVCERGPARQQPRCGREPVAAGDGRLERPGSSLGSGEPRGRGTGLDPLLALERADALELVRGLGAAELAARERVARLGRTRGRLGDGRGERRKRRLRLGVVGRERGELRREGLDARVRALQLGARSLGLGLAVTGGPASRERDLEGILGELRGSREGGIVTRIRMLGLGDEGRGLVRSARRIGARGARLVLEARRRCAPRGPRPGRPRPAARTAPCGDPTAAPGSTRVPMRARTRAPARPRDRQAPSPHAPAATGSPPQPRKRVACSARLLALRRQRRSTSPRRRSLGGEQLEAGLRGLLS